MLRITHILGRLSARRSAPLIQHKLNNITTEKCKLIINTTPLDNRIKIYNYHSSNPIYKEVPNQQELITWLKSQAKPARGALQRSERTKSTPKLQRRPDSTHPMALRAQEARRIANEIRAGNFDQAKNLLARIPPNDRMIHNAALHTYCGIGDINRAFAHMSVMGENHVILTCDNYNRLIRLTIQHNDLQKAELTFEHMKRRQVLPNSVTFNLLLGANMRAGKVKRVTELLTEMKSLNISHNSNTRALLIEHATSYQQLTTLLNPLKQYQRTEPVLIAVSRAALRLQQPSLAFSFLNQSQVSPMFTYKLIETCAQMQLVDPTLNVWNRLKASFFKPSRNTYINLLRVAPSAPSAHALIDTLWNEVLSSRLALNRALYHQFIRAAAQAHHVVALSRIARHYFTSPLVPHRRTYNLLIWAYASNNQMRPALMNLVLMKKDDIRVNEQSLMYLITALSKLHDLRSCLKLMQQIRETNTPLSSTTLHALVTMSRHYFSSRSNAAVDVKHDELMQLIDQVGDRTRDHEHVRRQDVLDLITKSFEDELALSARKS